MFAKDVGDRRGRRRMLMEHGVREEKGFLFLFSLIIK
jgi:hypothetical protein